MIVYQSEVDVRLGRGKQLLELLKRSAPEGLKWRLLIHENGPAPRWMIEQEFESHAAREAFWRDAWTPEESAKFWQEYDECVERTVSRDYLRVRYPEG